ncbi:TonB-dependent receptor [Mucilaginibacter conchicola]|uniref:TonB-dependent receptor n=1 Tax=Mucilaginibacter conchicola TaxID=2303333 RepID=A0A372NWN1_9SPHI|nr:TonB-dependent receptor [Mucilaginibacter conchicola]RFZ94314.1 TonB-dependent receptor [Mucilaginibacter conchicola]
MRNYTSVFKHVIPAKLAGKVACCLSLPFLLLNTAKAQTTKKDSTVADTSRIRNLNEVQIQSSRSGLRNTSPTPLQIIKGPELERLNSFSVADAIKFFSGVQLKDYGGIGGLKTINVRSLGTNHTAVFYDGMQMGNAQNGQVDLGRISLDNIEEIALYSGQKSEIYQPAKAFSAASALYLQTIRPKFEDGQRTRMRIGFKTGSFGLINPSVLWQQKLSDNISSTVSAEWTKADGIYKYRYTNGVYNTTLTRDNSDIDAWRVEAGLNGQLADSSGWSVKVYNYSSERGLPGAIVSNKFSFSQRQWDRNTFMQSSWQTNSNKRYSLMLNAKYADDYQRYLDPEYITDEGVLDNRFHQHELYLSAANRYRITPVWDVALSTDYQLNTLDANLYHFAYPTRNTFLTALASQLKLKRFNLQASVLGTFVDDKVKAFESAGNKTEFTPAVTASWQPFADNGFLLRAFYKNIFRMPTFNDLYYTYIGNTLLKPEYAKQYDLGFTYSRSFSNSPITSLSIQTDAYYNKVKDKIVAIPGANLYRWIMYNIGNVSIKGLEVNLQTTWKAGSEVNVNAAVNYTYQQARYTDQGVTFAYNIPYIPLHSGSFTAGAEYKKFELNYSYLYTGMRYTQLSNNQDHIYNQLEPWYTHDASVGYNTIIYKRKTKLVLEINNLLNQDREIIANFPMPRRFYRLKISYNI